MLLKSRPTPSARPRLETKMEKDFSRKVLEITNRIPRGKLMTYSAVAGAANSPRAWRAVGSILRRHFRQRESQLPISAFKSVPCHRVIRSDGRVGGFARGEYEKERLLRLEGHAIENHKIQLPGLQ